MIDAFIQERYPRQVKCRDDFEITIQPLTIERIPIHMAMLLKLDEAGKAKLPHNVSDPNYAKRIQRQIEDGTTYRLGAWIHDETIIGSLSLYLGATTWIRHTGEVVWVTLPEYRRYGIAVQLFEEIVPLAVALSLEKIYAKLTEEHLEGIKLVKRLGFKLEATLVDHARDSYGRYHNMYCYSIDLEGANRAMQERMTQFA